MCGIAGRFNPFMLPPAPGWEARVAALLAHRGPDGTGRYLDQHCELVHRRLALIDLSPTGHQPLGNEDGSVQVVYNGEIYNHRELRRALKSRGHTFRGTSDTEVLVHLYEDLGEHLVERLRGIFAFALYDQRRSRLVLARDRFGVKPLFYSLVRDQLVFASEIKAITALPGFRARIDRQACYDFLGLGYVPEPATGFANVAALPAGSVLVAGPEGNREWRYHQTAAQPDVERTLDHSIDALSERLLHAVERQAVADVPVAALLSGGIDSSLVVAAHSRCTANPTTTFNVRFPEARSDETEAATRVARHCGTGHHTIDLEQQSLGPDALMQLLRHFDQPFADPSLVPMYAISAAIRERNIICALSGDGGDEAFGGYQCFWRANRLARLMHLPAWCREVASAAGTQLAGLTRNWGRQVAKAAALAGAGRSNPAVLVAGLWNYLSEPQKEALVVHDARADLAPAYRLYENGYSASHGELEDLSRQMTDGCFAVSLPSDMLRKVDMMSMRASVEVRVPLLDESIVDLGLSLPHQLKTDGREGKRVLRGLARRWLPPSVAAKPKHGFSIPLDVMLDDDFHSAMDDLLLADGARTQAVLDRGLMRGWLKQFREARVTPPGGRLSREGLYQRVFSALALELWLREQRLSW